MVTQEQTGDPNSNPNADSTHVCNEMVMEEGLIPKIRKPYTISKQRERWSEEEHDKFIEALKLHGRAWRRIEEHVGTKTAIQIRSHAQKFFSKVVRKSYNSDAIDIPPPRPKRKPSHPYPRKLVNPTEEDKPLYELERSISPTSVLSPATLASSDSTEANGSPSPVSSSVDAAPQDDAHVCPSLTNDLVSGKFERFPGIDSDDKPEVISTKILKLFGKDVIVPSDPSDSLLSPSKSPSLDMGEELIQASIEKCHPIDTDMQIAENVREYQPFYYVDGSGNQVEKPIPLPLWVFFGGIVVPLFGCQTVDNILQKGSGSAGSSIESVNGDAENQLDKESKYLVASTSLEKRSATGKPNKGFVPYKRCFSQIGMQSATENSTDEEEAKRVRLSL